MASWLWCLSFAVSAGTPDPLFDVEGARVLTPEVYEAVARAALEDGGRRLIDARPGDIEVVLRRFLRGSGYELAEIQVTKRRDRFHVDVDEGRFERIAFPEEDAFNALLFSTALDVPENVFNRPDFARRLDRLAADYDLKNPRFELRELKDVNHRGFQIEGGVPIPGLRLAEGPAKWELAVYFDRQRYPGGLGVDVRFQAPDGLVGDVLVRHRGLLAETDVLQVAPRVGLRIDDLFQDGRGRSFVTRAGGQVGWISPPIVADELRVGLSVAAEWLSRQRRDLNIRRFAFFESTPQLALQYYRARALELSLGMGAQYRDLLYVRDAGETRPRVDPVEQVRFVVQAAGTLDLDTEVVRDDYRHRVDFDIRQYLGGTGNDLLRGDLRYRNVFSIGWDQLRLEARGTALFTDVVFTDELSIGDYLRGLLGDEIYLSRVGLASLEYRLSLLRDRYHLSAFADSLGFDASSPDGREEAFAFAQGFGLGAHALVEGVLQVNFYGVFGLAYASPVTPAQGAAAVALTITKAY